MKRDYVTRAGVDALVLGRVDPLVLGRIEIPRIGVTAIVREGDDDTTLAIAVGHISGTARPGERGNMALAGHRDSFFRALRGIRPQDMIRIVTPKRSYEYVVDLTEVVAPEDTRVLDPTSDTVLSLVTCYPFKYVGHAPNRFIVRASLVAVLPVAASGREVSQASGDFIHGERTRR
jgi:sortase A